MTTRTLRSRLAASAAFVVVAAATSAAALSAPAAAAPTPGSAAPSSAPAQQSLSMASTPEKFDWKRATLDVPWTAGRLPDGSRCPGGRLTFKPVAPGESPYGIAKRGGYTIQVRTLDTADVTRDGRPDQLVQFLCQKGTTDIGYSWYYVYSFEKVHGYRGTVHYRPYVRAYVTSSDFAANAKWLVRGIDARYGAVDVKQWVDGARTNPVSRVFRWSSRRGLVANRALPVHPEADRTPR